MYSARIGLLLCAAAACHEPSAPNAAAPTPPSDAEVALAIDAETDAGAALAWADAIRLEKWDDAWRALEALAEAEKAKPEVRYARGRVALARGEHATASQLFDGLETSLPLLADDVARWRAEARLEAGPFDASAAYFSGKSSASAQLKAARGFVKAGADFATRARAAADRVVLSAGRTRVQEAEARAIRAKLATHGPGEEAAAAADARWIRLHAPEGPFDKDAATILEKLDPSHPLAAEELMTRGRAFADAGRTNDALTDFEHAATAPGKAVPPLDRLRARADALFKGRGKYVDASAAYAQASQQGGPHAAEDAFMSARALARADKDDDAIRDYEALERKFPHTTWADQAAFHAARLHMLRGRWREAANGFDAYRKTYPTGAERKDAHRDAAISHLMAGDYKIARRLFGQLADDEPDGRAAAMEALAALKEGDKTHAIARWTEVARSKPLTWPALVSRARLTDIGAPIPPTIDPPDSAPAPEPLKIALPPPVDMLHRIGLDGDAEDALAAREAVVTQGAGGRTTEALCVAYGMLGRARRRFQIALSIPNTLLQTAPGPRTRWAWECAFPSPFEASVRARETPPPELVWAVMRQESNFSEEAVSPARAVGLLQLLPETAKAVAEEAHIAHDDARLTSPPHNIELGALYLKDLLARFKGNVPLALGGYNGGPDAIARWTGRAAPMELDVFVEHIPFTETRIYVARVMANFARYGYMQRGEAGVPKLALAMP
jgi:soluble lytic murein transglycosylase